MRFSLLLACLLVACVAQAQMISNVDFDEIKSETADPNSPYYFPKQLARLQASDTTLQVKDYQYLYYGQVFQKTYNPYGTGEISDKYKKAFAAKQYKEAYSLGEKELREHPFNLRLTTEMIVCASKMGSRRLAQRYADRYFGFLKVIRNSGDGHSLATAFVTVAVDDEYAMLGYYNLDYSSQSLVGATDVFALKPSAEAAPADAQQHFEGKEIFFNASKPLNYLGSLIKDK